MEAIAIACPKTNLARGRSVDGLSQSLVTQGFEYHLGVLHSGATVFLQCCRKTSLVATETMVTE
ncbi:amino acid transporter [Aspergillus luchuensis]|uniref:Amino acid transporter n=1 Tax=Aspergillus kawachii TaxID=1069201 RepID=A0A146FJG0_ASPKA|nr:amino acid transporter [Aspergillus luchuensis]